MEVMIESLHHVVDQLAGIFLTFLGQVEIEHGGFETGVAEVALDDPQVDAGFEEMGGVGMAQGVDRNAFFEHPSLPLGLAKGILDAALSHGLGGLFGIGCFVAASWKNETGMAMSEPVLAQQMEGGLGQRDVTILGTLAAVDMDHHAPAVDVGDFEMAGFVKAQAAGVDGGEKDVVREVFHLGQNASDFFDA
jgi:hypothetical protein